MKNGKSIRAIEKKAWKLHCAGKTIAYIAKELGKGTTTISRYLDKCRDKLPDEIKSDKTDDILDRLEAKSWAKLELLMDNPKTNENVIKDICFRVLSAKGKLIEQKKVDHSGTINHKETRLAKIQEGLKSFGYLADTSS